MEKIEVAEELRVSLAAFDEAQRKIRAAEPRRLTYLLACKPDGDDKRITARRVFRFSAE